MDRTNEQALDLFADLLEPCSEILSDDSILSMLNNNASKVKIAQAAIRNHKKAIVTILALLEGKDPSEYKVDIFLLPIKVLKFLNTKEVQELFPSQGQKIIRGSFGSATGNTEEKES